MGLLLVPASLNLRQLVRPPGIADHAKDTNAWLPAKGWRLPPVEATQPEEPDEPADGYEQSPRVVEAAVGSGASLEVPDRRVSAQRLQKPKEYDGQPKVVRNRQFSL